MAAAVNQISLQEYLRTEYRPDREYVHGRLKEKPLPEYLHGVVQGLLFEWFREHRKEWGIGVSVETRTQVEEGRVRLPDVVVVRKGEGTPGALLRAPLVAIEVLSSMDSYADLRDRASDLRAMGTQNVWLVDPKRRTAEIWSGTNWLPSPGKRLQAVDGPLFVDLDWLWAEVDDE